MNKPTVVLCFPAEPGEIAQIESEFDDYKVVVASQETIANDIFDANVFCGHAKALPLDWKRVVSHGKLRWIQSSAAGLDHCLSPEIIGSDIVVSGCSGLFANQVAEQTLALLFAIMRRLPVFLNAQGRREFVRRPTDELHGKTVGIIGFGGNGRRIAELIKDVAAKVLVSDKFPDFAIPDFVTAVADENTIEVFEQSDVVIVTLPLTAETKHIIDHGYFSAMRPGSYFINVARGAVIKQSDLVLALTSGRIAFAGLDVVDPEPLPESSPLWRLENVLITPHVGAQSQSRVRLTTKLFCLNRTRFESGQTLINQVDKTIEFPHPKNRLTVAKDGSICLPK